MRTNIWKLSTVTLAAALTLVVGTGLVRDASADPQPRMKTALEHLEAAREALKNADDDKGGHRVKAIEATAKAIEETKLGIGFDNKH
jgi:anti-sigma-K factor RskA